MEGQDTEKDREGVGGGPGRVSPRNESSASTDGKNNTCDDGSNGGDNAATTEKPEKKQTSEEETTSSKANEKTAEDTPTTSTEPSPKRSRWFNAPSFGRQSSEPGRGKTIVGHLCPSFLFSLQRKTTVRCQLKRRENTTSVENSTRLYQLSPHGLKITKVAVTLLISLILDLTLLFSAHPLAKKLENNSQFTVDEDLNEKVE